MVLISPARLTILKVNHPPPQPVHVQCMVEMYMYNAWLRLAIVAAGHRGHSGQPWTKPGGRVREWTNPVPTPRLVLGLCMRVTITHFNLYQHKHIQPTACRKHVDYKINNHACKSQYWSRLGQLMIKYQKSNEFVCSHFNESLDQLAEKKIPNSHFFAHGKDLMFTQLTQEGRNYTYTGAIVRNHLKLWPEAEWGSFLVAIDLTLGPEPRSSFSFSDELPWLRDGDGV